MTNISKRKLKPETFDKLFKKLTAVLEKAGTKRKLLPVLNQILTESEIVMLTKRIAIILMLAGSTPHERIAKALKVSPTTVSKISLNLELGKYNSILEISKQDRVDLEKIIWLLLTAGGIMPPRAGRRYWKNRYPK